MLTLVRSLRTSKSGASAAEYALILAVMGGFIVAGALLVGQNAGDSLATSGKQLSDNSGKTVSVTAK